MDMSPTTRCARCGTMPSSDRPAFTWSMAVQDGHRSWTCAPCVRTELPVIESGILAQAG
jgi:hypothetical protein